MSKAAPTSTKPAYSAEALQDLINMSVEADLDPNELTAMVYDKILDILVTKIATQIVDRRGDPWYYASGIGRTLQKEYDSLKVVR